MRYTLAISVAYIVLLTGCAHKSPPSPVIGVDIISVSKGDSAPFTGTLFSPFYLDNYLQWKDSK